MKSKFVLLLTLFLGAYLWAQTTQAPAAAPDSKAACSCCNGKAAACKDCCKDGQCASGKDACCANMKVGKSCCEGKSACMNPKNAKAKGCCGAKVAGKSCCAGAEGAACARPHSGN